MNTLKVLSIDMDFFQNVDMDTLIDCYPDGHDFKSFFLSAMIWHSRYSNPYCNEALLKVSCPEDKLNDLKEILTKQDKTSRVLVSQSHLDIYNFIHDEFATRGCTDVEIVNIDMHHDMFKDNPYSVDCGNWLDAIREQLCTSVTWISHPISAEGMDDVSGEDVEVIVNNLDPIKNKQFDIIFLCRSDMWYAPHLDDKFYEVVDLLLDTFADTVVSESLTDRKDWIAEPHQLVLDN